MNVNSQVRLEHTEPTHLSHHRTMPQPCYRCGNVEGEIGPLSIDPAVCSASFQHHLHTNEPPPDFEATRLRNTLLHEAPDGVRRLDQKVARLLAAADDARAERDTLQTFIDCHKVILSPVRRIPPEIISEIFLHTCGYRYDVFNSREGPWVLGQICSRWRAVALNCSTIWSSM